MRNEAREKIGGVMPTGTGIRAVLQTRVPGRLTLLLVLTLILVAGCAKTQVVLLPDPDGKVGNVEIATERGTQTLDKAWQASETSRLDRTPGSPKQMEESQVRATFQEALAAQPIRPENFILYFKKASADLTAESIQMVPQILAAIKKRASKDIIISGHTDSVGRDEYNRTLSLKRAKSVAEVLVAKGVDREDLEITYHGKENPLVPSPDGVEEPKNRRVEITVR